MSAEPVKFYQVGSFAVGNRLLDITQNVRSTTGSSRPPSSGHRPVRAVVRRLGRGTRSTPRCTGHRPGHGGGQRHRLPGGLLHPYPETWQGSRGCTPCSATPRRWPTGWQRPEGQVKAVETRSSVTASDIAAGGRRHRHRLGDALSGMFERNDDVLFICYDNEAYMNTSVPVRHRPRPHAPPPPGGGRHPVPCSAGGSACIAMGARDPLRRHRHRRQSA